MAPYRTSPKRSSHTRERSSPGTAPTIDELVGQRDPRRPVSATTEPSRLVADDERRRSVAEVGLVGATGQARAQVRRDRQRRSGLGDRRPQRTHRASHGPDHVVRAALLRQAQRGVDGGRVRLVEVRRRHRREPERTRCPRSGARAPCGSARPRPPSSWRPRRTTPRPGCPCGLRHRRRRPPSTGPVGDRGCTCRIRECRASPAVLPCRIACIFYPIKEGRTWDCWTGRSRSSPGPGTASVAAHALELAAPRGPGGRQRPRDRPCTGRARVATPT